MRCNFRSERMRRKTKNSKEISFFFFSVFLCHFFQSNFLARFPHTITNPDLDWSARKRKEKSNSIDLKKAVSLKMIFFFFFFWDTTSIVVFLARRIYSISLSFILMRFAQGLQIRQLLPFYKGLKSCMAFPTYYIVVDSAIDMG